MLTKELLGHFLHLRGAKVLVTDMLTMEMAELMAILNTPLTRLCEGEPIQYVTGTVAFLDLELNVSPDVLIPRPETEELAQSIIRTYKGRSLGPVIDLCTGSGCLAIALAKHLSITRMTGVDLSSAALKIAHENSLSNGVEISFAQADILKEDFALDGPTDLIVSNPPYVLMREKVNMHENVLQHEPAMALFVADDRPLIFYERIAQLSSEGLIEGGSVWLEINEALGTEVAGLFDRRFSQVKVFKDFRGKDRFVSATKD